MQNNKTYYLDRHLLYAILHKLVQINHQGEIEPLHSDNTDEIESVISALLENLIEKELLGFSFTIRIDSDTEPMVLTELDLKGCNSIRSFKNFLYEKYKFKFSPNNVTIGINFEDAHKFIDDQLKPYLKCFIENKLTKENVVQFNTAVKIFTGLLNEKTSVQGMNNLTIQTDQFSQILNQSQKIKFESSFPEFEIVTCFYLSGAIDLLWIGNFKSESYEYGLNILSPSLLDINKLRIFFGLKPLLTASVSFGRHPYVYDEKNHIFNFQTNSGQVTPLRLGSKDQLTQQGKVFLAFLKLWENDLKMRGHYSAKDVDASVKRIFGFVDAPDSIEQPYKNIWKKISHDEILRKAIIWHKETQEDKPGWVFRIDTVD